MTRFLAPLLLMGSTALIALNGCHTDMRDQPRYETLEASDFFANGQSARPLVKGTVSRGSMSDDTVFLTGKSGGEFVAQMPIEIDATLLARGQERFNIFCAPCHARTGNGDGMIVQRGFRQPPSYHSERLRNVPDGHLFDVMTHGFGAMPRYSAQIEPHDRWAIVAYIRALQLSQNAKLDDVPAADRALLEEAQP